MRARDEAKDQSYFLFAMPPEELSHVRFPLGELTKDEVRELARKYGLPNAEKAESQEICFVPDGDYAGLVERALAQTGAAPGGGEIVDTDGKVVGRHEGVHRFTVGQRRGLGGALGGPEPRYVVSVDALRRRVVVGREAELGRTEMRVGDLRWLAGVPDGPVRARVQVRHRHRAAAARIEVDMTGAQAVVRFDAAERALTPGQAAVFYDGDAVLGGGWIQ
jgi:tRNA-specific 2-thiouridylase